MVELREGFFSEFKEGEKEMSEWKFCRKKPVIVKFRPVRGGNDGKEEIKTREGTLYAYADLDWIIEGTHGELYPIKKKIFEETYEVLE